MNEARFFAVFRKIVREEVESAVREQRQSAHAVTFVEAARQLSCSAKHINRLVKSGHLMPAYVGSLRRIPVSELARLMTPAASPRLSPRTKRPRN